MKNIFFAMLFVGGFLGTAHAQLNDYKYIIVPKQFNEFKKENQYQTSTLVKYLFEQKGFTAFYGDELPAELSSNRCLGLWVDLIDGSSMFTTKAKLVLKDCAEKEVFSTKEGKSKSKEFKTAYSEAIRDAFDSFNTVNYVYNGNSQKSAPITVSFKNDVKKLEDNKEPMVPKNTETAAVIKHETSTTQQTYKSVEPVQSNLKKGQPATETLYAQELPEGNGYQLVDSTPKILMKVYKTSMPDYYLGKRDGADGVLLKKDGKWFFEYYEGGVLKADELNIKF